MMYSKQILALPPYTFRIRLAQIIIAVLTLILNIVSIAILAGYSYGALGYGIFTPIATCVIVGYWYYSTNIRQEYYNRWAILILDCFAVVWWLSMWSVLASWAAALQVVDSIDDTYGYHYSGSLKIVYALTAVSAAIGAIEFVLFIVTLVNFSMALHRARNNERQMTQPFAANPTYQMNDESVAKPQAVA